MSNTQTRNFTNSQCLVVKIGSALLTSAVSGTLKQEWLDALADDVADLMKGGKRVVIVSSGAVAVGRQKLGLIDSQLRLEEKQAAAAAGQVGLFHSWEQSLQRHEINIAQILLTPDDTEERRRHLNARNTIETLFALGVVPVINENDTVATEEIRFGDNDRLGARVAQMIGADTLILLSDIDGLYTSDPRIDKSAKLVEEVQEITPEISAMAGNAVRSYSSGGMVTKLEAARIATRAGCRVVIADGNALHCLTAINAGGRCTWFMPNANPSTARKRWISSTVQPAGSITIDDGAGKALAGGKSLLPAGVIKIEGVFKRGDTVLILDHTGYRLGSGLSAYSSDDAKLIAGHQTREIERLLGYSGRAEMIHRDNLVLES